jgi:hypothetical protein
MAVTQIRISKKPMAGASSRRFRMINNMRTVAIVTSVARSEKTTRGPSGPATRSWSMSALG